MEGIEVAGLSASVSAVDFFSSTSSLAIGNECGLVGLLPLKCEHLFKGKKSITIYTLVAALSPFGFV